MSEQTSPLHHDTSTAAPAREPAKLIPQLNFEAFTMDATRIATVLALAAILLLGGVLRLSHNNWDASGLSSSAPSGHLHPDERFLTQISLDTKAPSSIANYFDTDTSALNPYNIDRGNGQKQSTFVYGTLPLFLNKAVASNMHTLSFGTLDDWNDYDHYNRSGRILSGLFDLGTIVLIFLVGRRLANRSVGLMGAFLYAASAFPIQNAHFFIVDPFVAFFATLALYYAVRSAQDGGWWNFAVAGVAAGLATACKTTAVSLLPVVVLAIGVFTWPSFKPFVAHWWTGDARRYADQRDGAKLDRAVATLVLGSLLALVAAFLAYRIAMPYAFRSPSLTDLFVLNVGHIGPFPLIYPDIMNPQWLADQVDQQKLLGGDAAFPPNVQWIGRSKWIWPLQQMVSWGMGPALGISAWLGVAFAAVYAARKRAGVWLVPLAWVLGYFAFMGAQYSLYMRYFLPLYPALAVFAAFLLWKTWEWAASGDPIAALGRLGDRITPALPATKVATRAGVGAVLVLTLAMGFAFYNIYTKPVTRVAASAWVFENVPEGSVIGHEHWDDQVPYALEGMPARAYGSTEFENFGTDDEQRVAQLLADIEEVDYVALSSRRLSGTIPRVPALWPVTSRYYEALETGELGFEKVAEFTSYPEIFGIELDDTGAEESYSVYDHPKVAIYKKTDAYSAERAREVLGADAFIPGPKALPGQAAQNAMQFRPDVAAKQRAGGTWSDIFDPDSITNRFPLITWLLAMELAAFALVPLSLVVFRGLPDRGFLLTKPLGVLGLAYLVYAPASYGLVDFTRATIALALALMVAFGLATGWRWRGEIVDWFRARWRFVAFAQSVYLLMFLFGYWLRLQNPDLWHLSRGGEKPMDFAYLNGLIRTTDLTQGPIDPWNAGGYLNYYYFGQFISATVTKLTGIVPEVAYNLIVPMFFALAAAATFSVAYNLAEATRQMMRRRPGGLPISARGPLLVGLFAVFLVLIAGNLRAVGELERNFDRVSPWHPDTPLVGPLIDPLIVVLGGLKETLFGPASFRELVYSYNWWEPSRALDVRDKTEVLPITEFPFWTFLFADLHAHLMAIPFSMTVAGIGLAVVLNFSRLNPLRGDRRLSARDREVASWVMVVLLGLIVGALRWINSWDFPPFLLLGAAAIFIGERAKRGRFDLPALVIGLLKTGVMAALTVVLWAQFGKNYNMFYAGFHQSDQTTELADYLSHLGIPLFLMAGFLVFLLNRVITRENAVRTLFFGSARRRKPVETAPVMGALALGAVMIIWAGTMQRWGVIALSGVALAGIVLVAVREIRSPTATAPVLLFVYAMAALGFGLSGGVEILTLDGDVGRMNTVFKFYIHIWMLFGVVAAYGTWYLFGVMRPQAAFLRRVSALNSTLVTAPRYAFAAVAALLLVLSLAFPYFGTRSRLHQRFDPAQGTGNDGMAYMETAVYRDFDDRTGKGGDHVLKYEQDGITWLRQHVQGTPTIMEGSTPIYHLGSRISIYTGLPVVSGWQWHQEQQRPRFAVAVGQRQADITLFYSGEDIAQARQILERYGVEWVIVGSVERNYYPEQGLEKFNDGLGGSLELAYSNPGMQIWHVIPEEELG